MLLGDYFAPMPNLEEFGLAEMADLAAHTKDISTDLMLRVLGALGVTAKVTFGRAA